MTLRNLRAALFPSNSMGPPAPPPPSSDEQRPIKRMAAQSISSLIPGLVAHRYYGTEDDEEVANQIEHDMLDCLDDQYLNKHLVYAMLELILIRLIPELEEQPISELLAERGVLMADADTLEAS